MVMSSQEERSRQMNLENRDILSSRSSSIITAPCSGSVDVELTSLGFQVHNMYSWNKVGSPDKPAHIGLHRASLPKPENDIWVFSLLFSSVFDSFAEEFQPQPRCSPWSRTPRGWSSGTPGAWQRFKLFSYTFQFCGRPLNVELRCMSWCISIVQWSSGTPWVWERLKFVRVLQSAGGLRKETWTLWAATQRIRYWHCKWGRWHHRKRASYSVKPTKQLLQ